MLSVRILGISVIISVVAGMNLTIEGTDGCQNTDKFGLTQACNYTYKDDTLEQKSVILLKCTLSSKKKNDKVIYNITCGDTPKEVTLGPNINSETATFELPLTKENKTVTCTAMKRDEYGNKYVAEIDFKYIPPPPTEPTTEPATTVTTVATLQDTPTTGSGQQSTEVPVSSSDEEKSSSNSWLKWALLGGAFLLALCAVACFIMMCRQKKQKPPDSTYANLAKDQSNYQTMPVPAPRSSQQNIKPKVTVENNYSEPKDSQDMSDALYADPKRFNGESDTYAEPYVKSKPKSDYAEPYAKSGTYAQPYAKSGPKSDTYAEPYKTDYAEPYSTPSEGNYAELSLPGSSRELYAKPIPKAQRKRKDKDDSNYSNVFGDDYVNTKK